MVVSISSEGNVRRIAGKFNLGYLTSVDKCRLSLSWQIIWLKCDKVVFIFFNIGMINYLWPVFNVLRQVKKFTSLIAVS